jgi:hypothetical protein
MGDSALVHFGCWRISGSPEILCVGPAGALAVVGVCCCTEGRATALAVAIGARSATHPPPIDLVAKL